MQGQLSVGGIFDESPAPLFLPQWNSIGSSVSYNISMKEYLNAIEHIKAKIASILAFMFLDLTF